MADRRMEKSLSRRVRKEAVFVWCAILLILGLWLFVSETVMSQNEENITVDEKAFLVLEEQYVSEIKGYLETQGYGNSGVALTRVVDEEGNRSYHVVLHHKRLYKLDGEEQEALINKIESLAFHVAKCKFKVKLLG